jgi:hypothetical protein
LGVRNQDFEGRRTLGSLGVLDPIDGQAEGLQGVDAKKRGLDCQLQPDRIDHEGLMIGTLDACYQVDVI